MELLDSNELLLEKLNKYFFLSKLFGFFGFRYNKRKQKFEESTLLLKYGQLTRIIWACTLLPLCFYMLIMKCYLERDENLNRKKSEVQRNLLCIGNLLQMWFGVTAVLYSASWNRALLLDILNAIMKCNKTLMKFIKRDSLSGKQFHTFIVIRIITSALDIYVIHHRPFVFNMLMSDCLALIAFHRLIMMAKFFEWHFIQTYLTTAVDALNEFMQGPDFKASDYDKLSNIYTQLFHLHQMTCKYYQAFALVTSLNLFRTVDMAFQTFQALFFTPLKEYPLEAVVLTFQQFMIPGMVSALDFVMICVMAEFLSESVERYRWTFLRQSLSVDLSDVSSQRTIDTILRQSCWEQLDFVLVTGHNVSRAMGFLALNGVISLTIAFLIYDAGKSIMGGLLILRMARLPHYQYYIIYLVVVIGCFTCHRIIAWCEATKTVKVKRRTYDI